MDRLDGATKRSFLRRIEEVDGPSPPLRTTQPAASRRTSSLRGILRPPSIQHDQRRASAGDVPQKKPDFDLEQGINPRILDTDIVLPVRGSSTMEDASSVSYEGYANVRLPSFVSDGGGTDTDGSFRTAQQIPTVASRSIGSGGFSSDSDGEFLSCRDGSDHLSIFSDAKSFASRRSSHRDSDGDSYYTCRRFNDQGLRSVLAAPTNVNTDQAFNIPLHVFAQSIEDEEYRKQKAQYRNQYIWRPVKIMALLSFVVGAIATTILLVKKSRSSDQQPNIDSSSLHHSISATATKSPTPSFAPSPTLAPSLLPSPVPSFAPSSIGSNVTEEELAPSTAPLVDENKETISPTLFVFITGNFQEIEEIP